MKYELYNEEYEPIGVFDTLEAVTEELRKIKANIIEDELQDMKRYPGSYGDNYDPSAGIDEYMADAYMVRGIIPFPKL